jgi:hypothetical protein
MKAVHTLCVDEDNLVAMVYTVERPLIKKGLSRNNYGSLRRSSGNDGKIFIFEGLM